MEERLARIEARLAALEQRLAQLDDSSARCAGLPSPDGFDAGVAASLSADSAWDVALLLGRSLLVLAGGYLLRALTAGDAWPRPWGVSLGLAYAAFWIVWTDRAAAAGRRRSAAFHAVMAAAVGFPLVWEARTRLAVLTDTTASVAWLGLAASMLMVAQRRALPWVAAAPVFLGTAVGLGLIAASAAAAPVIVAVLAFILLTRGLSWSGDGGWLLWVPVIAVDGLALLFSLTALGPHPPEWLAPIRVAGGQWLLWGVAEASRLLDRRRGRSGSVIAAAQGAFALLLVVLGLRLPWTDDGPRRWLALAVTFAGLAAWRTAGGSVTVRVASHAVALGVVLIGTGAAVPGSARPLIWGAAAVVCTVLAGRGHTPWPAAVFAAAFAWGCGLLPGTVPSRSLSLSETAMAAAALIVAASVLTRRGDADAGRFAASVLLLGTAFSAVVSTMLKAAAAISAPNALRLLECCLPMLAAVVLLGAAQRTGVSQARTAALIALLALGARITLHDIVAGGLESRFVGLATLGVALLAATFLLRTPSTAGASAGGRRS